MFHELDGNEMNKYGDFRDLIEELARSNQLQQYVKNLTTMVQLKHPTSVVSASRYDSGSGSRLKIP